MQPVLLAVHLDKGKEMRLSLIAASLGILFRPVRESEYALPIGALFGNIPAAEKKPKLPVNGEMIVMANMTDQQTDMLLKAIRESGMPPIRLKAVLTPTNQQWSFGQIYHELNKEHFFFGGK